VGWQWPPAGLWHHARCRRIADFAGL